MLIGTALVGLICAGDGHAQVAARQIARGAAITAADIRHEAGRPTGVADDAAVAPGWVARRVIAEGEPLREPAVGRPPLIRAGEEVDAVWSEGGITLLVRGTAIGAAGAGERVLVRIDGRRRLQGTAIAPGRVRINNDNR